MFDSIVDLLLGTPPEIVDMYVFTFYLMEVSIRMSIFGFVLRFISNLFGSLSDFRVFS